MRKITKFPKLVIDEAKNLKKFATPEELARLNIKNFDPNHTERCIYGLCTGDCNSSRAMELIKWCARRVYNAADTFKNAKLNGSPSKKGPRSWLSMPYLSPIEVFIGRNKDINDQMNAKLIAFLKGERKRLV